VHERYDELATAVAACDRELAIDLLAVIDGLSSVQTTNPMVIRLRSFRDALDRARTVRVQPRATERPPTG
jgi:hypothetical protein